MHPTKAPPSEPHRERAISVRLIAATGTTSAILLLLLSYGKEVLGICREGVAAWRECSAAKDERPAASSPSNQHGPGTVDQSTASQNTTDVRSLAERVREATENMDRIREALHELREAYQEYDEAYARLRTSLPPATEPFTPTDAEEGGGKEYAELQEWVRMLDQIGALKMERVSESLQEATKLCDELEKRMAEHPNYQAKLPEIQDIKKLLLEKQRLCEEAYSEELKRAKDALTFTDPVLGTASKRVGAARAITLAEQLRGKYRKDTTEVDQFIAECRLLTQSDATDPETRDSADAAPGQEAKPDSRPYDPSAWEKPIDGAVRACSDQECPGVVDVYLDTDTGRGGQWYPARPRADGRWEYQHSENRWWYLIAPELQPLVEEAAARLKDRPPR